MHCFTGAFERVLQEIPSADIVPPGNLICFGVKFSLWVNNADLEILSRCHKSITYQISAREVVLTLFYEERRENVKCCRIRMCPAHFWQIKLKTRLGSTLWLFWARERAFFFRSINGRPIMSSMTPNRNNRRFHQGTHRTQKVLPWLSGPPSEYPLFKKMIVTFAK